MWLWILVTLWQVFAQIIIVWSHDKGPTSSQCLHIRVLYLAFVAGELPGVAMLGSPRISCTPVHGCKNIIIRQSRRFPPSRKRHECAGVSLECRRQDGPPPDRVLNREL